MNELYSTENSGAFKLIPVFFLSVRVENSQLLSGIFFTLAGSVGRMVMMIMRRLNLWFVYWPLATLCLCWSLVIALVTVCISRRGMLGANRLSFSLDNGKRVHMLFRHRQRIPNKVQEGNFACWMLIVCLMPHALPRLNCGQWSNYQASGVHVWGFGRHLHMTFRLQGGR